MGRGPIAALAVLSLAFAMQADAAPLPDRLTGHGGPIMSIAVSEDGTSALTASFDYSAIFWRLDGADDDSVAQRLIGHDGAVNDIAFIGPHAVSTGDDAALIVWNLEDGSLVDRLDSEPVKVFALAVAPDESTIATARWDGSVRLYAFDGTSIRETARLEGHSGPVNAVAFGPDGQSLFSAGGDGTIRMWDIGTAQDGRIVHEHGWGLSALAVLDADRIAFGAVDGTAAILTTADGTMVPLGQRSRPVRTIAVNADLGTIAVGDITGAIAVYDEVGRELSARRVADGPIWDLAFVPGTQQILHVGLDDFVSRWQIAPREMGRPSPEGARRFQVAEDANLHPGEIEFRRKCSVCHTLTPDGAHRAGPTLYKLFGRRVGSLPGYPYSDALLGADVVWTEETLSQLFADGPDHMLPGTKMPLQRLRSTERLAALVEYLKQNTGGEAGEDRE